MEHKDKQEIHCHGCGRFVQFILNFENDGAYQVDCPKCGHKHYRVIEDGKITEDRWVPHTNFIYIYGATATATSTSINYGTVSSSTCYYNASRTIWS